MVTSVAQDQDQAVCIYFMVAYFSGSMKSQLLKERRIFDCDLRDSQIIDEGYHSNTCR